MAGERIARIVPEFPYPPISALLDTQIGGEYGCFGNHRDIARRRLSSYQDKPAKLNTANNRAAGENAWAD